MDNKKLLASIARLQTKIDMLETEFLYIDKILVKCGFTKGIKTLKETVHELLEEKNHISSDKK